MKTVKGQLPTDHGIQWKSHLGWKCVSVCLCGYIVYVRVCVCVWVYVGNKTIKLNLSIHVS